MWPRWYGAWPLTPENRRPWESWNWRANKSRKLRPACASICGGHAGSQRRFRVVGGGRNQIVCHKTGLRRSVLNGTARDGPVLEPSFLELPIAGSSDHCLITRKPHQVIL